MATPVKRWSGHNVNRINDAMARLSVQKLYNERLLQRIVSDPKDVTMAELVAALGLTNSTIEDCRTYLSEIKTDIKEGDGKFTKCK